MSEKTSKTFSSRFTMVKSRTKDVLGVVAEEKGVGTREFRIIWENGESGLYGPKELFAAAMPFNGNGKKLMLELMTGTWWVEGAGAADGLHR